MKTFRQAVAITLLLANLTGTMAAAGVRDNLNLSRDAQGINLTSEYVFRYDPDETLMPVYIIGAVAKPGLYHIPLHTDLVTLLALSGGTTEKADLGKVTIKKSQPKEVAEVDVERVMSLKDLKSPALNNNDVVLVGTRDPAISSNTVLVVGIISGLLGIVVSGILISKELSRK